MEKSKNLRDNTAESIQLWENQFLESKLELILTHLTNDTAKAIMAIVASFVTLLSFLVVIYIPEANNSATCNSTYTILLQDEGMFRMSQCTLSEEIVKSYPPVTGVITEHDKVVICISVIENENWNKLAAQKIEEITHYIVENRTEELFGVDGRHLLFLVKNSETTHNLYVLPYKAIRGYTAEESKKVNYLSQLKYYSKVGKYIEPKTNET